MARAKQTTAGETGDYTRNECAAVFNCAVSVVDDLLAKGVLESYKLTPGMRGSRRIRRDCVEAIRHGRAVVVHKDGKVDEWALEAAE